MAVALDSSTPAPWSGTTGAGPGSGDVSASFTAPADALLVVAVAYDTSASPGSLTATCSDSGGLAWTAQVERQGAESPAGGGAAIFTARTTSAVSRTVSVSYSSASGTGTKRKLATCYVFTGVDVDGTPVDAVTASNEGGSTTSNLNTTSLTPGADGVLVAVGCDWNEGGLPSSANLTVPTGAAADYSGQISAISGYRACSAGVATSANLHAGVRGPQWKWCQVVVRAAATGGGGGFTPATASGFLLFH